MTPERNVFAYSAIVVLASDAVAGWPPVVLVAIDALAVERCALYASYLPCPLANPARTVANGWQQHQTVSVRARTVSIGGRRGAVTEAAAAEEDDEVDAEVVIVLRAIIGAVSFEFFSRGFEGIVDSLNRTGMDVKHTRVYTQARGSREHLNETVLDARECVVGWRRVGRVFSVAVYYNNEYKVYIEKYVL